MILNLKHQSHIFRGKIIKTLCFTLLIFIQSSLCQSNWQQLDSPGGGNINKLFKVSDLIFLAGTQSGSIYRSSDSGVNWNIVHAANHISSGFGVNCFEFNSNQDIIVGTYINGIMYSTDMGLTWVQTNCGGGDFITNTSSGKMFSYDKIFGNWKFAESLDSGKTWFGVPYPFGTARVYSMVNFGNIVFVGLTNFISYSTDLGNSWSIYGTQFNSGDIHTLLIFGENEMLIGSNNGVFYTSDHGLSWQVRNNGIPSNSKKIYELRNKSDTIFACGNSGLLYTTDLGNQWIHYNNNTIQHAITSVLVSSNRILAAAENGVFNIESNQWINSSNGIYNFNPLSINSTANNDLIYNTSSGLFKSTDDGVNWTTLEFESFYGGCTFIHKSNLYFVQTVDSLFYLSTDYGTNWSNTGSYWGYNTGMSFSKDDNRIYAGFYKSRPFGNPPYSGFRFSTNFGASWIYISQAYDYDIFRKVVTIPGNLVFTDVLDIITSINVGLYRLEFPILNWIETNTGLPTFINIFLTYDKFYDLYVSQSTGIYRLDKSDYTWHLFAVDNMNNVIYMSFNEYNHIIAINDGNVYASVNGNKWDYVTDELDSISFKIIKPDNNGYFYAADYLGRLYRTLTPHIINELPSIPELLFPINNQQVIPDTVKLLWNSSSPLVMNYSVNLSTDSSFNNYLDTLVVDTSFTVYSLLPNQNYYWRVKAFNEIGWGEFSKTGSFSTNVSNVLETGITITEFALHQNYPNPFNPTTSIQYALSSKQFVTLKVYDVLGKEITTLINEEKPAGEYEVEFDGSGLTSGIYFYRIKAGSYSETRKMILLR